MTRRFRFSVESSAAAVTAVAALVLSCSSASSNGSQNNGGGTGGSATTSNGGSGPGVGGESPSSGTSGTTSAQAGASNAVAGGASGGSANVGGSVSGSSGGSPGSGGSGVGSGGSAVGDPVVWPNDMSHANSDDWLAANHDRITQLRPKVLVVDLENTTNAAKLITDHIKALKIASTPHGFKDPSAQPALVYELVSVVHATKGSTIDYKSWNTTSFADSMKLKDPANPTGPNLTLCEAFEKGVINEVWCMAGSDPKCGETQEAKQVYDATGKKVAGKFVSASNGDNITNLGCKVTARITDFNSKRGTGCHQHAMGHAWERYMDAGAVPTLAKQAKRFLNWDMDKRYSAPFSSFYQACSTNSSQTTDCMVWASDVHVKSGATASKQFDIADISQGCGNAHYYPNTTGNYSYDAKTPDPEVSCACENYGLHNGTNGLDLTNKYTNAMTDKLYPQLDDDCGGHGTAYLYQNFPGPGTKAQSDDGSPMHNWWIYLFY